MKSVVLVAALLLSTSAVAQQDQATVIGKIAEVLSLGDRCPYKPDYHQLTALLFSAGTRLTDEVERRITAEVRIKQLRTADFADETLCAAAWAMYGPNGFDVPALLTRK